MICISQQDKDEGQVRNIAFVPRQSALVLLKNLYQGLLMICIIRQDKVEGQGPKDKLDR